MIQSIVVVDDHALLAHSLATALEQRGHRAETIVPESLGQLVRELSTRPSDETLVILDIDLGDAGRALPLIHPLCERGLQVLILSGSVDRPEIGACLEAGACAYVSKSRSFDELTRSIERVLEGQEVLSEQQRLDYLTALWEYRGQQEELSRPFRRLTPREAEVLQLLCNGDSVQTIASTSYVSVPTVRTQVRSILQKLEVGSQLEAVTRAYRSGWHMMREIDEAG